MRRPILSLLACLLSLSLGCIEDNTSSPDNPEPEPQPSAEPSPPEPSPPEPSPPEPDVMPEPTPPEPEPAVRVPINHRAAAAECDDERRPGTTPDFDGPPAECFSDEDCPGDNNGRCTGNSHDGWYCTYDACFADADCDGVCECGGGFRSDHNVCLGGDCRIDADCGPGGYCSPSFGDCGAYLGVVAYYCHTAEDECVDDADCGGDPQFGFDPYCAYNPGVGHWTCAESHCAGK